MKVIDQLSTSLGRKDQYPNRQLGYALAQKEDTNAIVQLQEIVDGHKNKKLKMDAIMALATAANENPRFMSGQFEWFAAHLNANINRVIWGSMIAITPLAIFNKAATFAALPAILHAMETGTVVTRDYGIRILLVLYEDDTFAEDLAPILMEQLTIAPDNQLGQYAEKMLPLLRPAHVASFRLVLADRRAELTNVHHIRRVDKIEKKLAKR